jgi:adenylate cyclase
MAIEIERKFLVSGKFKDKASHAFYIAQGYLNSDPERSVRIRIQEEKAFLTIKGIGNQSGTSRFEWEKAIPMQDARDLLGICEPGLIEKTRYFVEGGGHTFEVDEFSGENKGLIIAEIELKTEEEAFEKPDWLGVEVTGIEKYYNAMLIRNPYSKW